MIVPFGDDAVLVQLGEGIDRAINRRIHALAIQVREQTGTHAPWGTPVPGYSSLLVPFDPVRMDHDQAAALLADLVASEPPDQAIEPGKLHEVEVRYGGQDGPDLEWVANRTGLEPSQVVETHASTVYEVYMLGFLPGFAYLGVLPAELALPRRDEPRVRVPAGSVAIASRQTAVYPTESPGGWHLIGRTEARVWDAREESPALLLPGDQVRFIPITG